MERRKFLAVIGAGSLMAAFGALGVRSFDSSIKRMIMQSIKGMNISEATVDHFLADAREEKFFRQFDLNKKGFIVAHTWLMSDYLPYKLKYTQYCSHIVGTFLLSTSYFRNGMQPGTAITYTGFYNPYKNPCSSPFSNIFYPSSNALTSTK